MAAKRVVVADDDVLLREGIVALLSAAGYEIAGVAGDAAELFGLVQDGGVDLAVVDIRMPPTQTWEGLDAARAIHAAFPTVGILLLSAYVEVETAIDLLSDGDRIGYLLKSRVMKSDDIVDALERIAAGGGALRCRAVREARGSRRPGRP